ncbi:MAG TPA: methyltransferase domain-containing protein [Polyangia bacterium]|nr:methyltransferase domain-containing protein [Polyangia bacterium]
MKLPEARPDPGWSLLREHDQQELWDDSIAPHVAASYRARMSLLAGLVGEASGPAGHVLDVGCAQGTLGLMLAERGFQVDLLDLRSQNIAYAQARYEHGAVRFHVGLLGEDCPPERDFDVVVCTEVLEHVPAPSELLRQLAGKVRPGGALCLTTPNGEYMFSRLPTYGGARQSTIDDSEANSSDGDAHRFLYTRDELITLVRSVGLRIERHGFFLPAWLEGHAKTRHLHRLYYSARHKLLTPPATLPEALGRRLCSSQYLVARRAT